MNKKQADLNKSKEYKFTCEVRIWHYDDAVCLCVCVCHCFKILNKYANRSECTDISLCWMSIKNFFDATSTALSRLSFTPTVSVLPWLYQLFSNTISSPPSVKAVWLPKLMAVEMQTGWTVGRRKSNESAGFIARNSNTTDTAYVLHRIHPSFFVPE